MLRLNVLQATDDERLAASFSALTFDLQKNTTRGETIGHSQSEDSGMCPVRCIARRITYLLLCNASPNTPLSTAYNVPRRNFNLKP